MFKYISANELLQREVNENKKLRAENEKRAADIDYIAMMCDVELESEEGENAQSEV